ncbi:MAG: type I-U CRISPR-associated helicase/endonuclease Cas3 [Planctomycetes bacterium]|nr:type I-U CRISPR-associated helicase/endonuclease Cas3 [Planctomycetota bacterium]
MKHRISFEKAFSALTGHEPYPWQIKLFARFLDGDVPQACNLPTGLGKTNVITIWLIALACKADLPRRLVYVVNRRTVVDQTTAEAEKLCDPDKLRRAGLLTPLRELSCMAEGDGLPLAISTLRGQRADNKEWSMNPARPAIICGTVDMIGSRLLFGGYRIGFRARPLHAGFLGQDAIIVHDEAHLEPAFQNLIETISAEQLVLERGDIKPIKIMQLTATARCGDNSTFTLDAEDMKNEAVNKRLQAVKRLRLVPVKDDKQAAAEIGRIAIAHKETNAAVLVYLRTLDSLHMVKKLLDKAQCEVLTLTGTMRGKERDELVDKPAFRSFVDKKTRRSTVYLLATSAGEVGIDISADHLVCDLSTFDSMAQRFGRVNRHGERDCARIDVVHPESFGKTGKSGISTTSEMDLRRSKTLELLRTLPEPTVKDEDETHLLDASPGALSKLMNEDALLAFTPQPTILRTTDVLLDLWALTSIRKKMPGRPLLEPYLHGLAEDQQQETHVAWRKEVEMLSLDVLADHEPADLLASFPLLPHEMLRGATNTKGSGVFTHLERLAQRAGQTLVWVVDPQDEVDVKPLEQVIQEGPERLYGATILLPHKIGGLKDGMLDGDAIYEETVQYDVSEMSSYCARVRLMEGEENNLTKPLRLVQSIVLDSDEGVDDTPPRTWEWWAQLPLEGRRSTRRDVTLQDHVELVERHALRLVRALRLEPSLAEAVIAASRLHDCGKECQRFQSTLGNMHYPAKVLAKSRVQGGSERFRHEFVPSESQCTACRPCA